MHFYFWFKIGVASEKLKNLSRSAFRQKSVYFYRIILSLYLVTQPFKLKKLFCVFISGTYVTNAEKQQ